MAVAFTDVKVHGRTNNPRQILSGTLSRSRAVSISAMLGTLGPLTRHARRRSLEVKSREHRRPMRPAAAKCSMPDSVGA